MCPETPQRWQTWAVLGLLDFLEWGLTKDLELDKSVIDFIPLSLFLDWVTKTIFDPKAMEEEGLEESTYLKLALSKLGF